MRTTVRLNDELLRQARQMAAKSDRTLAAVIEDALRVAIDGRVARKGRVRTRLPTDHGRGVRPGVDLTNNAALVDLMEARDAAR